MTKLCSHCHQPLPELRAGVRLSPLKAHIFDVVKRADSNGITIEDINTICFDGRASAVNVRNHIHQINDALAGTDFEIRGGAPGMVGYFHIVKRHWNAVPRPSPKRHSLQQGYEFSLNGRKTFRVACAAKPSSWSGTPPGRMTQACIAQPATAIADGCQKRLPIF